MMVKVRCECGQLLGLVKGEYDLRCPKCKKVTRGDTKADRPAVRWPAKLMTR